MSTEQELCRLLDAIQNDDEADTPADNAMLAATLGWSLDDVAACLQEAKDRSFVWGMRSGQKPMPWFTDLEVTVQGKRYLAAHGSAPRR